MAAEPNGALTGAGFDLANAGYAPMPDPYQRQHEEAIGSDSASLREAAEQRSGTRDEVVVREYRDANGEPVASHEAITLDRAGRDYARATAADKAAAESRTSAELATRIDALRAEAVANDPDAAEFYGFESPQADGQADKVRAGAAGEAAETADTAGAEPGAAKLDAELEKALRHPQGDPGH